MAERCTLSTNLIEGYLYELLDNPKSEAEILEAVQIRFGDEVCCPSDLSKKTGGSKWIKRVKSVLAMGVKNQIYTFDAANSTFNNNQ
jgi:hypothetical protein